MKDEQNATDIIPMCVGCNKRADELEEYIEAAEENEMTIVDFLREEEGTYNPTNGHFLCTDCYVTAGMPSSPYGWKAP